MTARRFALLVALSLILAACGGACGHDAPPLPGNLVPAADSADTEAAGVRFIEILTGGANASDSLPLLVGIHGRGGSPAHFARILSSLSLRARVILPYGLEAQGEGFSWFPAWRDDAELAEGTRRAADRLAAMITELIRRRPTSGKPIVTGFSQGGILSYTLAVLHPEAVRAAFPVSGLLATSLLPSTWPAGHETPRVRAFHGADDDVVPIAGARATVRRLQEIGFDATLSEYPGVKHTTTPDMRRDLVQAIAEALGQ